MKINRVTKCAILIFLIVMTSTAVMSCGELFPSDTGATAATAETTSAIETASTPETTRVLETTRAPETTRVPETTRTPETTRIPETTCAPETTRTPETSVTETEPEVCVHEYEVLLKHEVSCTVNGFTVYACHSCGDVQIGDMINAEGHDFGEWETVELPTAEKTGLDKKVCLTCGHEHTHVTSLGELITPAEGNITYGYYSFSYLEHGEIMQAFYRDMLAACEALSVSDRNVEPNEEGLYIIDYIDVSGYDIPLEELAAVWKIFVESNPSYYWLSNEILIQDKNLCFSIDGAYAMSEYRKECDKAISNMKNEAMSLVSKCDSDLEIALKMHDYLTEKLTYAYAEGTRYPESAIWAHNLMGAAAYGKGVCEAYTKAYLYLCTAAGLECLFVSGETNEPHAWNYVKLHDSWYAVDVTWDDGNSKYFKYEYFGLSEESMSLDHTHDTTETFGLYYLPELPETAKNDLNPVVLYEDGVELDTYNNADEAFSEMSDGPGEYLVKFLKNDAVINSPTLPTVVSITFEGMNEELDEEYFYGESTLTFAQSVSLGGNVTFKNVCVSGELDLGEFTLTTEGIYCRLSGIINGGKNALIKVRTTYKTDIEAETAVGTDKIR